MFEKGVDAAKGYTRCIKTIMRCYGSTKIMRYCGSCIIVNNEGWVLTCKHIVDGLLIKENSINTHYNNFKKERSQIKDLPKDKQKKALDKLEQKYGFSTTSTSAIQLKNIFLDVVSAPSSVEYFIHPDYDLALAKFDNTNFMGCNNYPIFKDNSADLKQGISLCRLGFPFAEFTDYQYNTQTDDIEWIGKGNALSPCFPIDGILTRFVDNNGGRFAIELSTPGLIGQSGGPLFDREGVVCGLQFETVSIPLGFDMVNKEILVNRRKEIVSNYPFMHLGRCIHVDIIKQFMDQHGVNYQKG